MSTVKAVLLKPLDGQPEGSEREFEKVDFDRLEAMGAVRDAGAKVEKAAAPHANKMAPNPQNKTAGGKAR